jgi:hypothetical protein
MARRGRLDCVAQMARRGRLDCVYRSNTVPVALE